MVVGLALHQLVEDREEEGGSLPRPSLSAGHEVTAGHDDGEAVLLHWSRHLVPGLGDVFLKKTIGVNPRQVMQSKTLIKSSDNATYQEKRPQTGRREGFNGGGRIFSSNFDRDTLKLGEIDPRGDGAFKQFIVVDFCLGHVNLPDLN